MKKSDKVSNFIRSFLADVRQCVVEEGWFGRTVTSEFGGENGQTLGSRTVTETAILHRTSVSDISKQSFAMPSRSFAEQLGWERPTGREAAEHDIYR